MARTDRHSQENHERWLVSYADFVTLLFAFFVVLFASSTVDQSKVQSFASKFESYVTADGVQFGGRPGQGPAGNASIEFEPPDPVTLTHEALTMAEVRGSIEQLEAELLPEINSGKIELTLQARGIVMSLRESAFFAPGEAALQPESLQIMQIVAESLTRIPGEIRLEGHTDDRPIHTRRYPSNWHLSTARAITVLKFLTDRYKIPRERLAVAGYGEFHPVASNDTPENRAKNRRVSVVILTRDAAAMEPSQIVETTRDDDAPENPETTLARGGFPGADSATLD